jgi:shikimate kinase
MHVYLTGFMGAGKSTVGLFLARLLAWPFHDLDEEIEAAAGMTVAQIFESHGEAVFRDLESRTLESLDDRVPAVVALGGGTLTAAANRRWIGERGVLIWLDVPIEVLLDRLTGQEQDRRPLYSSETETKRLYRQRLSDYRDADLQIGISSADSAEQVAAGIRQILERHGCGT